MEPGFPRIYRVDQRVRHAVNFFIVAVGGLFVCLTVLYLTHILRYRGTLGELLEFDLGFAGVALFLGSGYNKKVVLHADAIEVEGWFRTRKLYFADIRGRQTNASSRSSHGFAYIFVPKDDKERKLAIPGSMLHKDQFFRDWVKTIPKL